MKNKSWVYRLVKQGGLWVPDTSNGWGAGKQIFFPGSTDTATNQPDAEGLTIGPDGALYVTSERNNAANDIPLNSILRFDPTQPGAALVATDQWDLTAEFPELHAGNKAEANLGFEGVTFVPDAYLVANGFVDASTGATYTPIDYPLHGARAVLRGAGERRQALRLRPRQRPTPSTASRSSTRGWATSWTCSTTPTRSGSGRCATTPAE